MEPPVLPRCHTVWRDPNITTLAAGGIAHDLKAGPVFRYTSACVYTNTHVLVHACMHVLLLDHTVKQWSSQAFLEGVPRMFIFTNCLSYLLIPMTLPSHRIGQAEHHHACSPIYYNDYVPFATDESERPGRVQLTH